MPRKKPKGGTFCCRILETLSEEREWQVSIEQAEGFRQTRVEPIRKIGMEESQPVLFVVPDFIGYRMSEDQTDSEEQGFR